MKYPSRGYLRPIALLVAAIAALQLSAVAAATPAAIMPQPAKYEAAEGTFTVSSQTVMIADDAARPIANYLVELLAGALGEKLPILNARDAAAQNASADSAKSVIIFSRSADLERLGPEGYTLSVDPHKVSISAFAPAGLFYGCQTLRQLLPAEIESRQKIDHPLSVSACRIEDCPRYSWRGMHLDVSRHFFTKADVKRYIDLLACYKLNVFHWHLTDDQGWRIEIKKYPLLTEVGAWRPVDAADRDSPNTKIGPDGSRVYGGFYTQDDIREVVAYAQSRFVTVVPEIEMPGHCTAALSAYPELSCTGGPFKTGAVWGVFKDVYCPGKDETFTFIDNVLDEVCDLFPSPYVHIGGDECPKDRWKQCPNCQQRIKENGLKDENELQSYFIKRVEKYLQTKNHRLIGWDEILQGGLAPDATVTSWRGMSGGHTAAVQGHDVIMCPESNCYFDHTAGVGSKPGGPGAFLFASPVPLNKVFAFEPTPPDLTPEQAKHILGAQGNVWTERIATRDRLDYMAFPRAIALAECLWTPQREDFSGFAARLLQQFPRLDLMGVKYNDDPLAHGKLIGQWRDSDHLPTEAKAVDFPITQYLTQPGKYAVRFEFLSGKNRIDIESVALMQNGKQLMRDAHPGYAGSSSLANSYQLSVPQIEAGANYTTRATIRANKGSDTQGQIFLIPTSAVTDQ